MQEWPQHQWREQPCRSQGPVWVHWYPILTLVVPTSGFPGPCQGRLSKGGKTRRGFPEDRESQLRRFEQTPLLCSLHQHQLGTWAMNLDTLLSKGVLYPVIGRLSVRSGLGLPGTGYRMDRRPGLPVGREGHTTGVWVLRIRRFWEQDCCSDGLKGGWR